MRKTLCLVLLFALLFNFGCKQQTTTPEEILIPQGLFPIKVGNTWRYTGYQIDTGGVKINGTEFSSSITIVAQQDFEGKNAFILIDSLNFTKRMPEVDTLRIYLEDDYIYAWIDLTQAISIQGFSFKKWVPFIKVKGNLNETYTILNLDTTLITNYGGPINVKLNITGKINKPEEIEAPKGKFKSYKFESTVAGSVSFRGVVVSTVSKKNYIWFSQNIGPIKHETPATSIQSLGLRRELVDYRMSQ